MESRMWDGLVPHPRQLCMVHRGRYLQHGITEGLQFPNLAPNLSPLLLICCFFRLVRRFFCSLSQASISLATLDLFRGGCGLVGVVGRVRGHAAAKLDSVRST